MKRINFTGRKKILQSDIFISLLSKPDEVPELSVSVDLKDYEFPITAIVFLEVQEKTRFERIELGSVSSLVTHRNCALSEFDDGQYLGLAIKVIEPSDGMLLGIATRINAREQSEGENVNRQGILPVVSADLSRYGVLWRVVFSENHVQLQIDRALGSRDQVVCSQLFKGFILPAAMRIVLERILRNDWDTELVDPSDLSTLWLSFVLQLGWTVTEELKVPAGERDGDFDQLLDDWLDEALRLLTNRIGIRESVITDFEAGVWK